MDRVSHFATEDPFAGSALLRWLQALSAAAILGLATCPVHWITGGPVLCPFRRFLGVDCYGCGMTRALSCLLHGSVVSALGYNRGAPIVLSVLTGLALSALWAPRRQQVT